MRTPRDLWCNPLSKSHFSSSYEEAKRRFTEAADRAGARMSSYSIEIDGAAADEFTIDVAILGPAQAPALVSSSGVHGVEGFLGSAIQLAQLQKLRGQVVDDVRWVFIHAVNPFGFSQIRRFNELNVDLNRNFLPDVCQHAGASAGYVRLNNFLNPQTPPSRFEPFLVKAIWNIARYGMGSLKQSIAQGQYEYPRGIFYGGSAPSQAVQVINQHSAEWIGPAKQVLHVDFHSGLGAFGDYKLLLAELMGSDKCKWYERVFGRDFVEATQESAGTAYRASGPMGEWLQDRFSDVDYRFVTAEFGTYHPVRVLASIRAENRAHHFSLDTSQAFCNAKRELMECFCPADQTWRRRVVASGLEILSQGVSGLSGTTEPIARNDAALFDSVQTPRLR